MKPEVQIDVQDIDHLGIIAGIVDEIGIVEIIDQEIGTDPREKGIFRQSGVYCGKN